jgi:hypothetical protein
MAALEGGWRAEGAMSDGKDVKTRVQKIPGRLALLENVPSWPTGVHDAETAVAHVRP